MMVIFRIGKVRDKKERVAKLEESKMFTNCSAFFVIHNGLKLDLVIHITRFVLTWNLAYVHISGGILL